MTRPLGSTNKVPAQIRITIRLPEVAAMAVKMDPRAAKQALLDWARDAEKVQKIADLCCPKKAAKKRSTR